MDPSDDIDAERDLPSLDGSLDALKALVDGLRESERDDQDEAPLPSAVGGYELHEKLGAGSYGRVFRATHTLTGEHVAIKLLHISSAEQARVRQRLKHELSILRRIRSENVATVHHVDVAGAFAYLVMELVEGESLASWLVHANTMADVVRVALGIARGLADIHRAGKIHRDLKPDNIMISANGVAKIIDFGLARSDRTTLGAHPAEAASSAEAAPTLGVSQLGARQWRAPEQLDGKETTQASDVCSTGLLIAAMLRTVPSDEPNKRDAATSLYAIVDRATKREPRHRFADGQALCAALVKLAERLDRPRPRWSLRAGVLGALLTVGVVSAWLSLHQSRHPTSAPIPVISPAPDSARAPDVGPSASSAAAIAAASEEAPTASPSASSPGISRGPQKSNQPRAAHTVPSQGSPAPSIVPSASVSPAPRPPATRDPLDEY